MVATLKSTEPAVEEFVKALKGRMKERGITPSQLARDSGCGRPYLYRVLSGEQTPSLEWAGRVGKSVGLKIRTVKV